MGQPTSRRHALCCGALLAGGLFSSLISGCKRSAVGEARLLNPCRTTWPDDAALRDLVSSAFDGIDGSRVVDTHAHLLGTGDSGSGCTIHPSLMQWWHPIEVVRRRMILNAACVDEAAASIDGQYVERLHALTTAFVPGARWWLFAFAQAHDDAGAARDDWSTFHVPDRYAAGIARQYPDRFDWVASIHPYAPDALQRLRWAQANNAVAVKWLPSAMNIDPASARCKPFFDALAARGTPLIVHGGEEKAAPGAGQDAFGNPLRLRRALERGVRVIVAHAASLGHANDTDRRSAPQVPAFDLFARLMDEQRGSGQLLGDVSAVFQRNRSADVWRRVLSRDDWHAHLLHGSDYPLPGVLPLSAPEKLVQAGLLDERHVAPLTRLREHNALLFDVVLKRKLRLGSMALPASIFEAHALNPKNTAV